MQAVVVEEKKRQTRRQSKGLTYFNRKRPKHNIEIGTLEEWYISRQLQQPNNSSKRRRLNMTVVVDSDSCGSDDSDTSMVELN